MIAICFFLMASVSASYCTQGGGVPQGTPNLYPIVDGMSTATLLKSVPNGKMYEVTVPHNGGSTTSTFTMLHLWGPGYAAGFAMGTLMKPTLNKTASDIWAFMLSEVTSNLQFLPVWLADMIALYGMEAALDLTYDITVNYTNSYVYDEIKGMADASGVDYLTVRRLNQIAGLTQGDCSMFGSWGAASANGHTIQLRALDWETADPFSNNPLVTVYHATANTTSNSYVTVGIPGLVGALTGVSDRQMGISEIGVSYPDDSFGTESRVGVPFVFLLRDILHYDNTVDDATNRMINSKRTCDLILGVGDGKEGRFAGYQHSASVLNVFDDLNLMPNASWHPKIPNVVYWGMDWICPGFDIALSDQIKASWGKITPELAIMNVTAVETSGDLHLAYYDLTAMTLFVSFHKNATATGPKNAYDRQFTQFDLKTLFAEQAP